MGSLRSSSELGSVYEKIGPYRRALETVMVIYIVPRKFVLEHGGGCGVLYRQWSKNTERDRYMMYVADDLPHRERLITIAHELVHLILYERGRPFHKQEDEDVEAWIDEVAKEFCEKHPDFLNSVYREYVRIG
jgi:Zn-dependent peptidase ImmA (M78 family)